MCADDQPPDRPAPTPSVLAGARIRPYAPPDEEAVRRLMIASFEPVSIAAAMERRWGREAFPQPWHERKWREVAADLAGHAAHCFVAVDAHDGVIGCVTSQVTPETGIGRIPDLMVDPAHRAQGLGR